MQLDRWTQSSVWYIFRRIVLEKIKQGIKINMPTREYITQIIDQVCHEVTTDGLSREDLGIYAGARAHIYFDGHWSSVNMDNIQSLAEKGTDVIFTEKQNIVDVHTHNADKYGIALVNTQGHLTKYGKQLIDAAAELGANIVTMNDEDVSGVRIAGAVSNIPRISMIDVIEYLGVSKEEVEEDYRPNPKEIDSFELAAEEFGYSSDKIEYLKHKRIEIDSVLAVVGNERLWEAIKYLLKKIYLKRNYNRAITIEPSKLRTDDLDEVIRLTELRILMLTNKEREKTRSELQNVKGFIDVRKKREEIDKRLKDIVVKDKKMQKIDSKHEEILEIFNEPDEESNEDEQGDNK